MVISEKELGLASSWLNLSESQVTHWEELYAGYLSTWQALRKQFDPAVEMARVNASAALMQWHDPELRIQSFATLNKIEDDLSERLLAQDRNLLSQVQLILAEPQKERLPLVLARRDRTACRLAIMVAVMGAATPDLLSILESLGVRPTDYDQLAPLIEQFVLELGPAIGAADRSHIANRNRMMELETEMALMSVEGPEKMDAAFNKRTALLSETALLERRVADINVKYAQRIAALLPEPLNQKFCDAFRMRSFYQVFPDQQEPRSLIRTIVADAALPDEQRVTIKAAIAANRDRYETVCKSLEQRHLDYYQYYAGVRRDDRAAEFHRDMLALKRNRLELNKELVSQVAAMLPDEVRAKHDAAIREWQHANR